MLRIDRARALPRVLGFVLAFVLTAGACGGAQAKVRHKKAALDLPTAEQPFAGATPPVRFFTINAVLAKHDGQSRAKSDAVRLASADPTSGVQSDAPAPAAIVPETSDAPFGLFTFRAPEGLLWSKWRGVQATMRSDAKSIEDCTSDDSRCVAGARSYIALSQSAAGADTRSRVAAINRGVNQAVRYVSDIQHHGIVDVWSSPLQTLGAGIGDCEDYAIAKFALLLAVGIPEADLQLMLVRDLAVRQDHAVLAVRIEGRWLVLDNRSSRMAETRDLPHFMPLFAIDHQGVSLFAAPYAERPHHESETDVLPAASADTFGGGQALPLML